MTGAIKCCTATKIIALLNEFCKIPLFVLPQIRLEFELFEINGPNYMGVCDTDFFLATGGSPTPMICGTNTGQHSEYLHKKLDR